MTRRMRIASALLVALVVVFGVAAPQAFAVQTVWLDFNNVTWPTFAGKNATDFEDGILAIVQADYAAYSYMTFTKIQPGGSTHSQIEFSEDFGLGSFGNAHLVDWDNKITDHNNIVRANNAAGSAIDVYVNGFKSNVYDDSFDNFTMAVGGTASHEFGHSLGLRHFDTYGPLTDAGNPNPQADHHIMATGSTGITGTDRTDYDRFWSEHSKDKLEYLDPANQPSRKRNEINTAPLSHAAIATAEPLTINAADALPLTGREVMVKVGAITGAATGAFFETDFYEFSANMGDRIYANIFSARLSDDDGLTANPFAIDSVLNLYNPGGALVYTNDDIGYNSTSGANPGIGDMEGDPGAGMTKDQLLALNELIWAAGDVGDTPSSLDSPFTARSADSILIDSPSGDFFTLNQAGNWYLEVATKTTGDTGIYELFVSIERTDVQDVIPEPATCALVGVGLIALLRRRRRK
ncbi:PEP-CTERM sorting domain-containing protein [Planctomycetota bacterium]